MAIFSTSSVMILISIVFISMTPSSTANNLTDNEIKHLCSKTVNLEACYKLLKSDHRTAKVDAKGLAEVSVDLASNKANKTRTQLNSLAKATHDSQLRNLYNLCSKNYEDTIRDLEDAKKNLHSGAYKDISVQVNDAVEEVKNCQIVFNGASSDHAHIKKKNKDFEFHLNIVKVKSDNLNKKYEVMSVMGEVLKYQ
ncbi:Pectinesterase [Handroanthus impetiginosus]|uniref:Pectinesterase n=1 Tax=Handroanthus impetiginosus TaxID=429701 RepID=A0A2G9HYW3_9LAMI|nr:Pectinesterase [Handroanthus impetiginosus]